MIALSHPISRNNLLLLGLLLLGSCKMSEYIKEPSVGFNGSFEVEKNGYPVNWITYTPKTAKVGNFRIYFDQKDVKEGKQSLRFDVKKCSDKGGRFSPGVAQEIPVTEGEEYRLTYWIKNNDAIFKIEAKAVNAMYQQHCYSFSSGEYLSEWTKKVAICHVNKGMNKLRFEVTILKPGTFWIDDVKLEKNTKPLKEDLINYELLMNDTVTFNIIPPINGRGLKGSFSRSSYDLSAFTISYDENGNLEVSGVKGCPSNHQNEIIFYLTKGTTMRHGDTIIVNASSFYNKLYLINVKSNGIVDTLPQNAQIRLLSKDLNNNYSPTLITARHETATLLALPTGVNYDEINVAFHKPETVGVFSYFAVTDTNGVTKTYPSDDYILMGGNTFNFIKK